MTTISRDEWLAALEEVAHVDDQGALTMRDLGALLGLRPTATKERVNKLVTEGKARLVRKRIQDTTGRSQWVPAYRLVK